MYEMTLEELRMSSAEVLVNLKAYDEGFSSTVVARTSYTAYEIIEGAKFKPMYHPSEDGSATVLEIDLLNQFDEVPVPQFKQAGSV
jgi:inward rectifier potassium channel